MRYPGGMSLVQTRPPGVRPATRGAERIGDPLTDPLTDPLVVQRMKSSDKERFRALVSVSDETLDAAEAQVCGKNKYDASMFDAVLAELLTQRAALGPVKPKASFFGTPKPAPWRLGDPGLPHGKDVHALLKPMKAHPADQEGLQTLARLCDDFHAAVMSDNIRSEIGTLDHVSALISNTEWKTPSLGAVLGPIQAAASEVRYGTKQLDGGVQYRSDDELRKHIDAHYPLPVAPGFTPDTAEATLSGLANADDTLAVAARGIASKPLLDSFARGAVDVYGTPKPRSEQIEQARNSPGMGACDVVSSTMKGWLGVNDSGLRNLPGLKQGANHAFNYTVNQDKERVIFDATWRQLAGRLGIKRNPADLVPVLTGTREQVAAYLEAQQNDAPESDDFVEKMLDFWFGKRTK